MIVGNTYCFGDPENGGVIGTVTYASVNEADNSAYIAIVDQNGQARFFASLCRRHSSQIGERIRTRILARCSRSVGK